MKYIWTLILLIASCSTAFAQKEQDFATKFMNIYGNSYKHITCDIVSPSMMQRIMQLDTLNGNSEIRNVLSQLKSIQIVNALGSPAKDSLFVKAQELAKQNEKRYKLYTNDSVRHIYLRKRNNIIVEMVFIAKKNNRFSLINLTGNMNKDFLEELTKM